MALSCVGPLHGLSNRLPVVRPASRSACAAAAFSSGYLQSNIAGGEGFDWFYASDADRAAQIRTPITDGAAQKPCVFRYKDLRAWWSNRHYDRPGGVESTTPTAWLPQSKPIRFTELGCPAIDRGSNQPNVFFDPKSSESFTPYFSRGWRDDAIQRAYLFWTDPANNAVESEGVIHFVMRGRASVASLAPDKLVTSATGNGARDGDVMELTRGQETELPQALKWQLARADEDYDAALVEARRITVDTTRIASVSFPMAVPPEEAERRCRRALMEAWVDRETAVFRLPPSRLALDPCDVVALEHDGRKINYRLISVADAGVRSIEAVRQDRAAYDLPPGAPRPSSLSKAVAFGAPEVVLLDLPQLLEATPAHRPLIAAHAVPWPGEMAVFRSPGTDGFELLSTFGNRAKIGTLAADLYAGPTSRFDHGNVAVVDFLTDTLESVTVFCGCRPYCKKFLAVRACN